MHVTG